MKHCLLGTCFAQQHWTVVIAFWQEHALVLGHCTAVWTASLHRCIWTQTSLLATYFALQNWTVVIAFWQEHCCNAMVFSHCTAVWTASLHRVFGLKQACWPPVLQSSTGQWWSLSGKNTVTVQWCWVRCNCNETLPAVSLHCRAALNSGDCILPWTELHCICAGSLHTCMKSKSP